MVRVPLRWPEQRERRWFRRIHNRLMNLLMLRGAPARAYLPFIGANLRSLFARRAGTNGAGVSGDDLERLLQHYLDVMRAYVPARYDGPVHLMWGDDDPPILRDPTMGWGAVTSSLTVHSIPGDHAGRLLTGG